MAIHAARKRSGVGGAFRVWVLAKSIDAVGLGRVKRGDVRGLALSLGVNPRTYERWVNEARNNDLVRDVQKGDEWYFILPSAGNAALAMGCPNVGNRKVNIPLSALIGKGWKARVYTAWEHGKQISREQIQKAINVPVSTQRLRDVTAGVRRIRNYAKSNLKASALPGVKEYTKHKAPFITRDGFVAWRLPDLRETSHAQPAGKGRARKANRQISKQTEGLSIMRQALTENAERFEYIRLFNMSENQRKATERKIAKSDRRIFEVYEYSGEAKSHACMWVHCPTA